MMKTIMFGKFEHLPYEAPCAEEIDFGRKAMSLLASLSVVGEIEDFEDYGDL